MSIGLSVGSRLPAYCSSMGRVLLASLGEKERRALLDALPREKLTPRTLTSMGELLAAVEKAREDGHAAIDQELELGLRSIAVPVMDAGGRVVAAINVGAQAERVSIDEMRERFLPLLRRARDDLQRLLV
jgi:IclR family pca regulon transcriptional regulator